MMNYHTKEEVRIQLTLAQHGSDVGLLIRGCRIGGPKYREG